MKKKTKNNKKEVTDGKRRPCPLGAWWTYASGPQILPLKRTLTQVKPNITLGPEPWLCKFNSYFAAKNARKSWLNDTMQQLVNFLSVVRG